MRSVRYIAGGKPHNLDDCIDYSDRVKEAGQATVLVSLRTEEDATEMWVLNRLYGKFEWAFPDGKTTKYTTGFGGCFSHETEERQKLSVDNANYRLNDIYERLQFRGIAAKGKNIESAVTSAVLPQFDYSVIYLRPKENNDENEEKQVKENDS